MMVAALGACSNDDLAVQESPVQKSRIVTLTATLSPKDGNTATRGLSDEGTYLHSTWAVNDELLIDYMKDNGSSTELTTAKGKVTSLDGSGKATVTVDLVDPVDGSDIDFLYPYNLAMGIKELDIDQIGTLSDLAANFDSFDGYGTLNVSGSVATLPTEVTWTRNTSVWKLKFTVGGSDITKTITKLNINVGNGAKEFEVTPSSLDAIYVALDNVYNSDVTITASTPSGLYSATKSGITLEPGKFYRSTVALSEAAASNTYRVFTSRTAYTDEAIPGGATTIISGTTTWIPGTYVVSSDVTITGDVTLTGDVDLILKDGTTLTVNGCIFGGKDGGIPSKEFSLNIYGQSLSTGKLTIYSNYANEYDFIGNNMEVHGGIISATNAIQAIETGGELTIYHGTLNATGSKNGICAKGDKTNFIGGTVNATSTGNGAAIVLPVDGSTLTISGGTVNATGTAHDTSAKGIEVQTGNLVISGGTVVAKGGDTENSNCGANAIEVGGSFTMNKDANVTATGGAGYQYGSYYHGGIGLKVGGAATISNGKLTATSGGDDADYWTFYPAIQIGGTLTISGSTTEISATCGRNSKGIYAKNISISGGTVFAQGGDSGNSTNGGNGIEVEENGTITVNGGKITAVGGVCNALGGDPMMGPSYSGGSGIKGNLTVNGGMVTASGGEGNNSYGVYWGSYDASQITLGSGITLYCNYSPNPTGNAVYGPKTTTCVYRYVIIK